METPSTPLQAAQALRAVIRTTRQETEATRRLAPQVVAGLIDTGLCRLALPGDLGGYAAEPLVTLKVYEELAWADASVAVVALNNHLPCLTSRFFPAAARSLLFGNVRHLLANSTRPAGQAVAAEGGYRVMDTHFLFAVENDGPIYLHGSIKKWILTLSPHCRMMEPFPSAQCIC